ncbi:VOC family protein [Candidatus Binatia bacterium]|nr:VOC family protein [Candidatus Binatia bacterium]
MTSNPYLTFDGNAEEAFLFYRSVFGGDFALLVRIKDMGGGPPGASAADLERIAHVSLPLGSSGMLMASDMPSVGHQLVVGNNVHISLHPDSAAEAQRLYDGLSAGGKIEMPLGPTPWAERYASFADRFGVHWMVNYAGAVQFQQPAH